MERLLLLVVLFALPMVMMAQSSSDSQARVAHQQAEALFLAKNPTLQKIDVAKLAETQKDEHKACATCGFEKEKAPVATTPMTEERLAALKANQEKLIATTKALQESGTADKDLLKKYTNAIKGNQQQIATAESQLAPRRKEAQKSSK